MSLKEQLAKIESYADLEEGWDGYSGKKISAETIEYAKKLLIEIYRQEDSDKNQPFISPVSNGHIQIEWDNLEIEITGKGAYELLEVEDDLMREFRFKEIRKVMPFVKEALKGDRK